MYMLRSGYLLLLFVLFVSGVVAKEKSIQLTPVGRYAPDDPAVFDEGVAEIAAYDPVTYRVFLTNGDDKTLDVVNVSDPSSPVYLFSIPIAPYGDSPTHGAVKNGIVAVSVAADPAHNPGKVVFFAADGTFLRQVTVGALPDMVTFTPSGEFVLTANEGEPEGYCAGQVDPEGSVSVIDIRDGVASLTQGNVRTADFSAYNGNPPAGVRIFGPGSSVAQDLEPEYLAVSDNSRWAWATLQENYAIAVIDILQAEVIDLFGLGSKDHSVVGQGLDPSDRDSGIHIGNWPVHGMFQPDGIASFRARVPRSRLTGEKGGFDGSVLKTFLITANEGDAREYDCFQEESRVEDLILDPSAFPDPDI